jgi:hypothetical protein
LPEFTALWGLFYLVICGGVAARCLGGGAGCRLVVVALMVEEVLVPSRAADGLPGWLCHCLGPAFRKKKKNGGARLVAVFF